MEVGWGERTHALEGAAPPLLSEAAAFIATAPHDPCIQLISLRI
jgi:hypothetical protein